MDRRLLYSVAIDAVVAISLLVETERIYLLLYDSSLVSGS